MSEPFREIRYGVATDHDYTASHKRERLSIWSSSFSSQYEGEAFTLPKGDGYMVHVEYGPKLRVQCPTPRTDANYVEVDAAINTAINNYNRTKKEAS